MRCALAWPLVPLALFPSLAHAAEEPAPDEAPPTYTTEVKGTVPDLVGRWFVVSQVSLPQSDQPVAVVASFWEVTAPEGKPTLTVRFVNPPPAIGGVIEAANKERRPWEPTPPELQALRDAWNTLPPQDRGVATVETTITGKDDFTDVVKSDDKMKDALFLIQVSTNFHPSAERLIREVYVYGAKEELPDGWRGPYASATIAAAPFPIPIALAGTFRMYRLDSVPRRTLLERILDVFAGCGRKA